MSTFWDGAGGALIGAAASGIVAVLAITSTRRDERELMREQMSLSAAFEIYAAAHDLRRRTDPFLTAHAPEAAVDWTAAHDWAESATAEAERFYAYASVVRPFRIAEFLYALWDELIDVPSDLARVLRNRDRKGLDTKARDVGALVTNLIDELDAYLRADHERRMVARRPFWRRIKPSKRPPFLRRVTARDVRADWEKDEYGLPKADY